MHEMQALLLELCLVALEGAGLVPALEELCRAYRQGHVSSILVKLGLADRTQAAIFGLQQRLVPLDQALDLDEQR
jgi:hypothetical protein